MPIILTPIDATNAVEMEMSGKLTKADYAEFVPELDAMIDLHGKLRLLLVMYHFTGVEIRALWQDLKFSVRHYNHFERIACVGDKRWEEYLVELLKPFTSAKVRYFEIPDLPIAQVWLLGASPGEVGESWEEPHAAIAAAPY